jgi:hypothetical protein
MDGWTIFGIVVVVALVGFIIFTIWRNRKKKIDEAWHIDPLSRAFKRIESAPDTTTPAGAKMYYMPAVSKDLPLAEVDRGNEHTFQKCECAGYPVNRAQHDIKVVVFESEQSPEAHVWCFKVPVLNGQPYYNSEWDMMKGQKGTYHYILAAELVVAIGTPFGDVHAIPYVPSSEPDKDYLARINEFSREHICLSWYDPERYEATKYHAQGSGHPIIAECPTTSLFAKPTHFASLAPQNTMTCGVIHIGQGQMMPAILVK